MSSLASPTLVTLAFAAGIAGGLVPAHAADAALDVPDVPPAIAVPSGHAPFVVAHAEGTQNYVCLPAPAGAAWKFIAPEATLFAPAAAETARQRATHFLSRNPDEGVPRPTWQHSTDTSRVWGRAAAASTDPAYVAPGAIPWLLVQVVGTEPGPEGGDRLGRTRFIQRVNTAGGLAPDTGCAQAGDVGAVALVPYSADYVFYRAAPRQR